ncbi:MAG: DNA polymerase I [Firmicutes bacterium]|nr:DNA polymerase I [Bacillota bacterium]
MSKDKLMLIDGNSLLHRAFYALPPLKTNDGIHTNGVYGFLTMLYRILDEHNPDYVSVAFDLKSPTFRHKEYEDYKAGRKKTPDELKMQFPILKDVLDKLNINRLEYEGFEADDIVGTVAKIGEENDFDVILVTGDKDYLQLVSEKTKVLITKRGITNLSVYDEEEMYNRYEISAKQFIDLKALMGDKSDNIPGVPGVGEKTGIKLLKKFNTLEEVYENIEGVSGKKLKEKLIENKPQAFMSKRLVTIVTDMPIDVDINKLRLEKPDEEGLYDLYQKLGFKSLLNKIDKKVIEKKKEKLGTKFNIVSKESDIDSIKKEILNNRKFYFKFIIEGENPLKDKVIGITIKVSENDSYYIDFNENIKFSSFIDSFKEIFIDNSIKKSGHNIKTDILVLLRNDIELNGIYFDSVIGQYLINPTQNNYNLKSLCNEYLNIEIKDEEELLGKGKKKKKFTDLEIEKLAEYHCTKVNVISKIEKSIMEKIEEYDMVELFTNIEMPLIKVLADMEFNGFKVDIKKLESLEKEFQEKIDNLTKSIYDLSGEEFNINSPKQLGKVLFEKLELPPIKKTKTGYSTSASVLEKLKGKHEVIEKILEYRQIVKIKTTYIDGLLNVIDSETKKVHSSFNQTITATGRISSTEPNLQNIPIKTEEGRKIRKVFTARDENYSLVDADYSQIELRVLAHISDDFKLKNAFYDNEDIHTKTASEVFDVDKEKVTSLMRSRAKAVNFGIVYGISDYGLSRDLGISRKEAKKYIDKYFENYKEVKKYMDDIVKEAKKNGYVKTILHRRRFLPEINNRNYNVRSFGERTAMNTPIQGSAADIIKIAMLKVHNELKNKNMKSKLILQVHDELIIETHNDEIDEVKNLLKNLMENAIKLNVPLKVDMNIGDNWYETK